MIDLLSYDCSDVARIANSGSPIVTADAEFFHFRYLSADLSQQLQIVIRKSRFTSAGDVKGSDAAVSSHKWDNACGSKPLRQDARRDIGTEFSRGIQAIRSHWSEAL